MPKLKVAKAARADLKDILKYSVREFGDRVADRYAEDLEATIANLSANPSLGREFRARGRSYMQYNCRSHSIFYTVHADEVTVVRVLHLAMDFTRHLPR